MLVKVSEQRSLKENLTEIIYPGTGEKNQKNYKKGADRIQMCR